MTAEVETTLREIVRSVLQLPGDFDPTGARQLAVESWDSLAHASLMLAVESEFGINIDVGDQIRLTSYATIRQYLEDRGV